MIHIGDFQVNNFLKPYIIAEIGANFNGDVELGKKMIHTAYKTGCNAVKFQSWTKESLFTEGIYKDNDEFFPDFNVQGLENLIDLFTLTPELHRIFSDYCNKLGIDFLSSVFSKEEVDLLEELNVKAYKIASMDLNNLDLITYISSKNKPVILSTGMGELHEIHSAVETIEKTGNNNIIILHCVSTYPPEDENINLMNIDLLRELYDYPIGFSDHTLDEFIPLAAISRGAAVIEKHFTIDQNLPGWDHAISATPDTMVKIVTGGLRITKALGTKRRILSNVEIEKRNSFRRSVVTKHLITKGSKITRSDITFKRPGTGLPPSSVNFIVGREARRGLDKDHILTLDDF
jgi:sialic acid synthase SpsE